jgi:DNA helicase HerA-like ATPase
MIHTLTKWENTIAPAVAIEPTEYQSIAIYWGATIPAIPDLISIEQDRSGMSYESALNRLIQTQQRWIQQLHGESRFTLSLRLIATGNANQDLILGLVGKTDGTNEAETQIAARNFFNKIRDTLPNGYPLQPCQTPESLALLRLPFLPTAKGQYGEFRRQITQLQTIQAANIDTIGSQINPWTAEAGNFQELLRALLCHPTPAAFSINLHPTHLNPQELTYLGQIADGYSKLASISGSESNQNRVLSTSTNFQEKRLEAEQAAQSWNTFKNNLRSPFEMTISLIAESPLPQSAIAALQAAVENQAPDPQQRRGKGTLILAQSEAQKIAVRQNWADLTLHRWANTYDLDRLPWLFSPEEVHSIFRLPIADRQGVWGLPSAPGADDARRPQSAQTAAAEIQIGTLHLTKKQLTQHLLICGVPGSGKTNTSLYLLETLWREHRIPWMVLEPAKTEYRGLRAVDSHKNDLLIFSLGDERIAPFRFNPFELPTRTNLDSHLGALIDLFSVSMSMWGPLPNVLEQLIIEAYKRKGFTLLGDNRSLMPPCFSDVASLVPEILPQLGYKKETTDEITAAINVRLNKFRRGALGRMLDTTASVPFDLLMQRPVILEMSQITNTDDRAFIMGLLLNRCYQYWTARRHEATGELKHLLLIEEAHNLLGNVSESASEGQANPKGKAVRNFANMLAEVRGFGQGIAIAEQNPEGLVSDVMVNTNIKLAHRVVEAKNREALGRSMLLTPQQEKTLASLKTGQMLYYIGGSPEPSLTSAPNFKDDAANRFNPRLEDSEIQAFFKKTFQAKHSLLYRPPFGCQDNTELSHCLEQSDTLVQQVLSDPKFKAQKLDLFLRLLAAPFGLPIDSIRLFLGRLLVGQGANHLSAIEIQSILDNAIALLAMEAVKEKGKVHGWLGHQVQQAHQTLVSAIEQQSPETQARWIEICRIPDHLLQMDLPHPMYRQCEAPGVFRYENKKLLEGDRTIFVKDMRDKAISYPSALQKWASSIKVYSHLNIKLQNSILICLAIQLTEATPEDLPHFLE